MRFRSMSRPIALLAVSAVIWLLVQPLAGAADGALDVWVNAGDIRCSDGFSREQASSPDTPWCTVVHAADAARPGDAVHVKPGRYVGTIRPAVSGGPEAPIRYIADGTGVVIDAGGAAAAVKLVSVGHMLFEGMTVTGAATQGVWMDGTTNIALSGVTVAHNEGHGIQILRSAGVTISRSVIRNNAAAGIFEGSGTTGGRYLDNQVTANGLGGGAYNGDGIQLGGESAVVARNTISGNGTPGPYEHGIYAGPSSRGYVIEDNVLSNNAGSNIKAAGGDGLIRYNRLEKGRLGLVFSDNSSPILAYYNLIIGSYQHAVFLTNGETAARAKLWNNTIVSAAPDGASGDTSALFVKAATLLDLRNNIVSSSSANNQGIALYVVDSRQLSTLVSNNNWFSSRQSSARHFVWSGSRLTLSEWRKRTGQDAKSIVSTPPSFDANARVTSKNLGVDRGQTLGLSRDYSGNALRTDNAPDLGAYET